MQYDPNKHKRRSIRLPGYDYSQAGYYFVTICCYQRQCLFGNIVDGAMQFNPFGEIVSESYQLLSRHSYVDLDEWIVMPNHFHGIIVLTDKLRRGCSLKDSLHIARTTPTINSHIQPTNHEPKRKPLGRLIGAFKTVSTKNINIICGTPGAKV